MSISSGLIVCIALFIYIQFLITRLGKIPGICFPGHWDDSWRVDNGTINVHLKFKPGKLTSSNVIIKMPSGSRVSLGAEMAVGTN